jgi:hypothetical protein
VSAPKYGIQHNLLFQVWNLLISSKNAYFFKRSLQFLRIFHFYFQDAAKDLKSIDENKQTYSGYLGRALDSILAVRECPVRRMTLCVTSDPEMDKCIKMKACDIFAGSLWKTNYNSRRPLSRPSC